jgi:hypothetical protein
MTSQEIILTIGPGGTVEMEGQHYTGQACDKDLRELAEALGTIEKIERKPEFYAKVKVDAQVKQTGGK